MKLIPAQIIFDVVVSHLAIQGKKSTNENGTSCAYRGKGGLTCAVGCLIKDSEYNPKMEGLGVKHIDLNLPKRLIQHIYLLQDLQNVHDYSYSAEEIKGNLYSVAKHYNLDSTYVELIHTFEG